MYIYIYFRRRHMIKSYVQLKKDIWGFVSCSFYMDNVFDTAPIDIYDIIGL